MIGLLGSLAGSLLKAGGSLAWKTGAKVVDYASVTRTAARVGALQWKAATATDVIAGFQKQEWKHMANFVGGGAVFGGVYGAIDPKKSIVGEAVREAAMGALFYAFTPALAYWQLATGAAALAVGLPSALERMDRGVHVNRLQQGYERSRPVNYDPTANASLRKRSLQYILQSRSNSRSFIGAEAKEVHQGETSY